MFGVGLPKGQRGSMGAKIVFGETVVGSASSFCVNFSFISFKILAIAS